MTAPIPRCQPVKATARRFVPSTCPHCEYDRRFPGFEAGGWMQQENNGPIVSCPLCNADGSHPTSAVDQKDIA